MATLATESETRLALFSEHDLRPTRKAVRHLAERLPFDARQVAEITLAVAEACINGVRHGHARRDAPLVTVVADPRDDHLAIEVVDHGRGFHPNPPVMPSPMAESGRGLALMHALMDCVAIDSGQHGTRVLMVKFFARQ